MIVYDYLLYGACFNRESRVGSLECRVRSQESRGESRIILERLQEALWRFQRCLGRLQEVLEAFLLGFEEIL